MKKSNLMKFQKLQRDYLGTTVRIDIDTYESGKFTVWAKHNLFINSWFIIGNESDAEINNIVNDIINYINIRLNG